MCACARALACVQAERKEGRGGNGRENLPVPRTHGDIALFVLFNFRMGHVGAQVWTIGFHRVKLKAIVVVVAVLIGGRGCCRGRQSRVGIDSKHIERGGQRGQAEQDDGVVAVLL